MEIYMIKKNTWNDTFVFEEVKVTKETKNQFQIYLEDEFGTRVCRSRLNKEDLYSMVNFSKKNIEIYGIDKVRMVKEVDRLYKEYVKDMEARIRYYENQSVKFSKMFDYICEEA